MRRTKRFGMFCGAAGLCLFIGCRYSVVPWCPACDYLDEYERKEVDCVCFSVIGEL